MATSGSIQNTFTISGGSALNRFTNKFTLTLSWSRTSFSAVSNNSTISWTLSLALANEYGATNVGSTSKAYSVVINGTTYSGTADVGIKKGETKTLATGSATIAHNSDGTKTFSYSCSQTLNNNKSYSASGSSTLDTIPRKATITVAPNFNDEENPTITYSNPSGTAVTKIEACISFDGSVDDIPYREISRTGTSYTFNLTSAERTTLQTLLDSGTTATVRFYIRTTIGSETLWHYLSKVLTFVNYTPILEPTVEDVNEVTKALTGTKDTLVRYRSNALYKTNATGRKGATIYDYVVGHGINYYYESDTIEGVQGDTFYFTVTDSRGHSSSAIVTKTLVNYVPLTCNLTVAIPTMSGTTTATVKGNCFYGKFGNHTNAKTNTLTVKYRYRSDYSYSDWQSATVTIASDNTYTHTFNISGLDYTKSYTFEAQAVDKLDTIDSAEYKISSSSVFDWSNVDFNFNVPVNFANGFTQPLSALKQLWNGNFQMESASASITLSMPISDLPNGIVLVFTPWNSSTGTANDDKLMSFFVSKKTIQAMPSKLHTFFLMSGADFATIGAKSLYIGHDSITGKGKVTGYATNDDKGTKNGITFDNTKFVLRYILGV